MSVYSERRIHMKKVSLTLSAILLAATISLTGHAQDAAKENQMPPALTEEQKGEMAKQMEAEYKEIQEKFSALSDDQKKEIYDLYDKVNVAKIKLLDKYVELGLISEDEAKEIQQHMSEISEKIRKEGQFIGFKAPHAPKVKEKNEVSSNKEE